MARWSRRAGLEVGLELDQDSAGWIENGTIGRDVMAGFLIPWRNDVA